MVTKEEKLTIEHRTRRKSSPISYKTDLAPNHTEANIVNRGVAETFVAVDVIGLSLHFA